MPRDARFLHGCRNALAAAPIVAAIPILLALALLVGLRWPAVRAMPVCAAVTAAFALSVWGVARERVVAALFESAIITFGILLILFGALFRAEQLGAAGALTRFQRWIGSRSADRRVQALLVAWSLGSFFEGAAGFGTPAALTAPLLVARATGRASWAGAGAVRSRGRSDAHGSGLGHRARLRARAPEFAGSDRGLAHGSGAARERPVGFQSSVALAE